MGYISYFIKTRWWLVPVVLIFAYIAGLLMNERAFYGALAGSMFFGIFDFLNGMAGYVKMKNKVKDEKLPPVMKKM